MIQIRYNARFEQRFDDLENTIRDLPGFLEKEAELILKDDSLSNLLDPLTDYGEPEVRSEPPVWYSDNQRRAAAMHMRQAGRVDEWGAYQRSHDAALGWEILYPTRTPDGILFIVRNTTGYSRFVYGDLSKKAGLDGLRRQQLFHKDQGWASAYELLNEYTRTVLIKELIDRMGEHFASQSLKSTSRGTQVATSFTHGDYPSSD